MTVWLVGISDCESNSTICLCSTKELALKKMFAERDRLVAEWKETIDDWRHGPNTGVEMYQDMVNALSSDDYENWDNYPHDRPYIHEMEVLDSMTSTTPLEKESR